MHFWGLEPDWGETARNPRGEGACGEGAGRRTSVPLPSFRNVSGTGMYACKSSAQ